MSDVEMCLVLDSRHQSAVRVTFVSCIEWSVPASASN